jgi:hypothetical protein
MRKKARAVRRERLTCYCNLGINKLTLELTNNFMGKSADLLLDLERCCELSILSK